MTRLIKEWLSGADDLQPKLRQMVEYISQLPGNAAHYGVNVTPTVSSPLKGKQIAFLGSSVTWVFRALGESFVYTNPKYDNQLYGQMVDRLLTLQPKWEFRLIDLYHDKTLPHGGPSLYMADENHPTRAGYQQKWLPIFEDLMER